MNTEIKPGPSSFAIQSGSSIRLVAIVRGVATDAEIVSGLAKLGVTATLIATLPNDWPAEDVPPLSSNERYARAEGTYTGSGEMPTSIPLPNAILIVFQAWIVTADARVVDVAREFPELFGGDLVGGLARGANVDADAFYPALIAWGEANRTPPEWLLRVFYLESRINPHVGNALGYVGLNQLAGTQLRAQFHVEPSDYLTWSASRQLREVVGPWYTRAIGSSLGHPPRSPGTLYALNLAPGRVKTRGDAPGAIMYAAGSSEYAANALLDVDRSDTITIGDFDAFMTRLSTQAPYRAAAADLERYKSSATASNAWKWALGIALGAAAIAGGIYYYKAKIQPTRVHYAVVRKGVSASELELLWRTQPIGQSLSGHRSGLAYTKTPGIFAFTAPEQLFDTYTWLHARKRIDDYEVIEFLGDVIDRPVDSEGVVVKPRTIVQRIPLRDFAQQYGAQENPRRGS